MKTSINKVITGIVYERGNGLPDVGDYVTTALRPDGVRCPKCREPKPVLADGELYSGDNGRIYHGRCSGASARYTGRDISGQKVELVTIEERLEWARLVGEPMTCESCGER